MKNYCKHNTKVLSLKNDLKNICKIKEMKNIIDEKSNCWLKWIQNKWYKLVWG